MADPRIVPVGDVIDYAIGGGWGAGEPSDDTMAVAVVRGADFPDVALRRVDGLPIRHESTERVAPRLLQPGDIVLEISGGTAERPTGRTVFVTKDMIEGSALPLIPASFCRLVRADRDKVESGYLYYFLQDLYARGGTWEFQNQSTGLSNFQFELFRRRCLVSVRPLAEQRAIAEVLGALDDKIAANTRLAAATDEYLATLFDRALRSSDVREAQLDDVALINVRSVNPGEGDLRYIDIAAVGEGHYAFPDLTPWATAPSRARRAVGHGDTLWSTVRPNRRSHALNLSNDPLLAASTGLAVLSPKSVGFAYLYEVARRPEFSAYLETVAEGSAYPAVRAERFATAPVPMIEDCARQKFEEIAAPLREHMHAHATENLALAATRDALLPALMSGKLRVRDAERAVESVV